MRAAAAGLLLALLLPGCGGGTPGEGPRSAAGDDRARLADAVHRAKAREAGGDPAGAEETWEEVLSLRPDHASALYATARLRRDRGDAAGALRRLEALRAVDPRAGRGYLLAAEILADPGSGPERDLDRAAGLAEEALALNPEESGPHLALGRILLLRGEGAAAAERLAVAARMNPRDAEAPSLLGAIHLRAGRREEAAAAFRRALRAARPAGAGAGGLPGGVPGEGDTEASLDPGRSPAAGELRAIAGLAALGRTPGGVGEAGPGEPPPAGLAAALASRGSGEAVLDLDGDGEPDAAAVDSGNGEAAAAVRRGGTVVVHR